MDQLKNKKNKKKNTYSYQVFIQHVKLVPLAYTVCIFKLLIKKHPFQLRKNEEE